MSSLDSADIHNCQACRHDIAPDEPKIVLGAVISGFQRFFVFHVPCWDYSRTNADPATRRFFAAHLKRS